MAIEIDINADVGEGMGNEAQLFPLITSCNIACGGHTGDAKTMTEVVRLAKANNIKIGAHPSYPDKANFGRKVMDISCADLYTTLKHQVRALMGILYKEKATLHHIKPHGALYNKAFTNEKTATVIVEVVKSIALPIKLYVPYGSVISDIALANGIDVWYEGFADRRYNDDLSLVSRSESDAMITNPQAAYEQILQMIAKGKIHVKSGVEAPIKVQTICVHGDTKNAIELTQYLVEHLKEHGIIIR